MQFSAFSLIIIYFFLRIRKKWKKIVYIYQEKKYLCDPDMSFKAYIIPQNDSMINEIIFFVNDNLSLFFFLKKMKEN